jgi:hypothetical protein
MATKQLLQILLKSREGIQSGATKVQDIVTEYLTSTGAKTISPDERYTINKEFSELAPSNVVGDIFGDFQGLQDDAADAITDTPVTNKIRQQNPGVEIRGDETFGELTEKLGKPKDQGLGSLYPKGEPGEIFDTANSKRTDLAGFMKEMRKAGIKNEDVMDVAKITDVAEGKRAATTLARAADMGADTKIKQEFLSDLDEKVMNNGPRYFQEEFQGYDSYGALLKDKGREVRFAIFDDLEALGVEEDKASRILDFANDVATRNAYQPEAYLEAIKQDLEMNNIKYDMSFWENYISKILELSSKAEPRFAVGGLV